TIDGVDTDIDVTINAGDTNQTVLQNMASAINNSAAEVSATVVNETGSSARLLITSDETGTAGEMSMQNIAGSLLNTSGIFGSPLFSEDFENPVTLNPYTAPRFAGDQDNNPVWSQINTDSYTGSQSLELGGNTWKIQSISGIALNGDVQVQVAMKVPDEGEIQAIGFYDTSTGNQYVYQVTGTQAWGLADQSQHSSPPSGNWQVYTFNLGADWFAQYGSYDTIDEVQYINDNDAGTGTVRFDSIDISDVGATTFKNELSAAQDASFDIDGLNFTRSSNSVDDAITGVTLNLLDTGDSTITVQRDKDAAITAIEAFVQDYNDAISGIKTQSAYNVETHKGSPLTTDTIIKRITYELRQRATGIVSGQPEEYNSLFRVGIEVDKNGVMSIADMGRLEAALESDPEEVESLFNASGAGVAWQLDDYLDNILGPTGRVTTRIETVNSRIDDIQEDIDDFQDYLEDLEEKLLVQWSNVEQAINANSNLSLFMAQRLLPSYQQQSS
ncbi:MAG: flagellar filament capping protein FliD, partial [Candidatus Omnitrophica bacterium]|nr:flagellar filament capping protein FliD [Candidatus Omnitrophota bacterium]MBD3269240.1 flagellar filament capping protein FliD [Candidatus Omnitrophota bacterium]